MKELPDGSRMVRCFHCGSERLKVERYEHIAYAFNCGCKKCKSSVFYRRYLNTRDEVYIFAWGYIRLGLVKENKNFHIRTSDEYWDMWEWAGDKFGNYPLSHNRNNPLPLETSIEWKIERLMGNDG